MSLPTFVPAPPAPPPAKRSWLRPAIVVGAVLAVIIWSGVAVMASPLGNTVLALLGRSSTDAIKLLPLDAPAFVHLAPTGNQLKNAEALKARFMAVPEVKEAFAKVDRSLMNDQGIDWETDFQPWLGPEIAVALTSPKGLGQAGGAPDLMLAMATRDQAKSDAFIKKVRDAQAKRGVAVSEKQYNGVSYLSGEDGAITTVGGFVVVASTEAALFKTIDMAQGKGGKSLADNPTYQELAKSLPADRLGDAYVDLQPFIAELDKAPITLDAKQREALLAMRAVSLIVRVEPNGVAFDSVALYDPAKMSVEQQAAMKQGANPLKIVGALPEKTPLFLAMRDLKSTWKVASAQLAGDASFANAIEGFKQAAGLSVDDDIFGWMTGEAGLALIEDKDGFAGNAEMPVGGLLYIEATDRKLVEEKLAKLRAALEKSGLRFAPQQVNGVEMQMLAGAPGMPSVGYGFVGDFLVIGTSREALSQAVAAKSASVANAATFKGVSASLPKERTGMVYVDLPQTLSLAERLGDGGDGDELKTALAALKPVKAIVLTGEPAAANNTVRSQLFVYVPA
jgi:hypothetical protein